MRCRAIVVGLLSVSSSIAACDDPQLSTFPPPSTFSQELSGHVYAGLEPVVGASVRVDPSTTFASDLALGAILDRGPSVGDGGAVSGDVRRFSRLTSTDSAGVYRFEFTPLQYDLSVRHDRDVVVLRGVSVHVMDVPLGVESPPSGFHAVLQPTIDPLPPPDHSVALFVSGDDARASTMTASGGVDVTMRRYESDVVFHAVEYVTAGGLAAAVAEAHASVRVRAGSVSAPVLSTRPLSAKPTISYTVTAPAGFTVAPVEVRMDMGLRTSFAVVARAAPGVAIELAPVTGARYFARATATRGEEVATSGLLPYDPFGGVIALPIPAPVAIASPTDGEINAGTELVVELGKGVVEHAFTPASGSGVTIRVLTSARATTMPDVATLGLPHPSGAYRWTVEHFGALLNVDRFTGPDARLVLPSWKSAPRTVTLE